MANRTPNVRPTSAANSTKASAPPPFSFPASTSCWAPAGEAATTSATVDETTSATRLPRRFVTWSSSRPRRYRRRSARLLLPCPFGFVALAPVEAEQAQAEEDARADEGEDGREPQLTEVARQDHEAVLVGRRVAYGLRGRHAERSTDRLHPTHLDHRDERLVRELEVQELRLAAADLVRVDRLVIGHLVELGELVLLGSGLQDCRGLDGDEARVDGGLHVRRLDRVDLLRLRELLGLGIFDGVGLADELLHVPRGNAALQRVERRRGRDPQRAEDHHETRETRECDEESKPGTEVRPEQQVDRAAEQPDARHDHEDPEDRRVPEILRDLLGRLGLGEEGRDHGFRLPCITGPARSRRWPGSAPWSGCCRSGACGRTRSRAFRTPRW